MDNYQIAEIFSLLSKLTDIHAENNFKAKSYAIAAFNIEKIPQQLSEIPKEKIAEIKGIGDSSAKKIVEILATGSLKVLHDLIEKTPMGVIEMLNIKGIGPKKISTIWKEMEIESIGAGRPGQQGRQEVRDPALQGPGRDERRPALGHHHEPRAAGAQGRQH